MQHFVSNYCGSFCSRSPEAEMSTNVCRSISLFYWSYVAHWSQETGKEVCVGFFVLTINYLPQYHAKSCNLFCDIQLIDPHQR